MRNTFLIFLSNAAIVFCSAQKTVGVLKPKLTTKDSIAQLADSLPKKERHWSISGQNSLTLNQATFSNWINGGANNIAWISRVNYNFTYQKDKNLWDNNIILAYGQNSTQDIGKRKSQDMINITTNYGKQISRHWFISTGAGLSTQFAPGYEDANNPKAKKLSNFMAPGYLNLGIGFTHMRNKDLVIIMNPANARLTMVLDKELQVANSYGLLNNGESLLLQFGFYGSVAYNLKIMESITMVNKGTVFSNYLKNPERLVLSYSAIINLKVNKYISSVVTLDLFYDHNQIQKTQLKQTLGVGLSYNFSNGVERKVNEYLGSWLKKQ
ncbi:MAG: DUF3078 domain-containing protein [Bergeyella sp.]|nr:DUF3078 domain-containing protein [Bergeyella sp.]